MSAIGTPFQSFRPFPGHGNHFGFTNHATVVPDQAGFTRLVSHEALKFPSPFLFSLQMQNSNQKFTTVIHMLFRHPSSSDPFSSSCDMKKPPPLDKTSHVMCKTCSMQLTVFQTFHPAFFAFRRRPGRTTKEEKEPHYPIHQLTQDPKKKNST